MTQVYFHCTNSEGLLIDRHGATVGDLVEACDHANRLVRSLISAPGPEAWRGWVLHVSDDLGGEMFDLPFASVLGEPH